MTDRKIEKKTWTRRRILILGSIVIFAGLLVYGYRVKTNGSKLNVKMNTLTLDTVRYGEFEDFIPIDGTVQPLKTVLIDAAEGGTVAERLIDEGSMVNKGDAILKLSNSDLQLEFMNKEALLLDQMNNMRNTRISLEQNFLNLKQQLLDIEHSYTDQKRQYGRDKILFKEKTISTADFEKSEDQYYYLMKKQDLLRKTVKQDSLFKISQIAQLESSTALIRQNLEMVKQSLDNLTIKAPVSGQLTSLNAEIGDNKQKGQNIGQIDVQAGFKIAANVDEHYISRIAKNLKAEFGFNDKTYHIIITKVLPQVTNGQFKIEMAFEGEVPKEIKPGQSLQIKLNLGRNSKELIVKNGGYYAQTGGTWVYVIKNGNARRTKIKTGRQNADYLEISDGLQAGDVIVASSYENFGNADELILEQ